VGKGAVEEIPIRVRHPESKKKLQEAAARRKEVNSGKKEIRPVNGAEAIAEARTSQELRRVVAFWYHRTVQFSSV
jgi:hypothetical protein